jgi:predicted ATPase
MEEPKKTVLVNLVGGPGAGKSTGMAYIFSKLKMAGVEAEMCPEFAKDKVWEGSREVFRNQLYIFGKQSFRLSRLKGKVDVIITDSPLALSVVYAPDEYREGLKLLVKAVNAEYESMTYFVERGKPYQENGRLQTFDEAIALDATVKDQLAELGFPLFRNIRGDQDGYDAVVYDILNKLRRDV